MQVSQTLDAEHPGMSGSILAGPALADASQPVENSLRDENYQRTLNSIREHICSTIPVGSIVLVISENEERLLQLADRQAWHFMRGVDGSYAGYHPANGAEAITQLELLRLQGAEFLVVPRFSRWWLEYYPEFREHLDQRCRRVWNDAECMIYSLNEPQSRQETSILPAIFNLMIWLPDRMLLNGLVFRLEHFQNEAWELGDRCFRFYKTRQLMEEFGRFFASRPSFQPRNLFELGIWHGGSIAMWYEWLKPEKHVAVDLAEPRPSAYFDAYLASAQLQNRVKLYWRTNQAEATQLRGIVTEEFSGPLDLVIDDASHLYGPTKASFETLFPLLRPGGLYVIEDWAWSHWPEWQSPDHQWADQPALTNLVFELVEAVGTHTSSIESLVVHPGFVVIERGPAPNPVPSDFKMGTCILRRPQDRYVERLDDSEKRS